MKKLLKVVFGKVPNKSEVTIGMCLQEKRTTYFKLKNQKAETKQKIISQAEILQLIEKKEKELEDLDENVFSMELLLYQIEKIKILDRLIELYKSL